MWPSTRMAGTTWDVVVLSSSPPARAPCAFTSPPNEPPRRVVVPESSPPMLSPPTSPKKRTTGASKLNLRAAAIPEGAVRGFATVSKLVRSDYFAQQLSDETDADKQAQPPQDTRESVGDATEAAERPKKRSSKKHATNGNEKPKAKPRGRKPKMQKDNTLPDPEFRLSLSSKSPFFDRETAKAALEHNTGTEQPDFNLTKTGKPRKPRTKKAKVDNEESSESFRPKKTRATKSGASKNQKLLEDAGSVVSSHFHNDDGHLAIDKQLASNLISYQQIEGKGVASEDGLKSLRRKKKTQKQDSRLDPPSEGLALEEAVARRRSWTPPVKDTTMQTSVTSPTGNENALGEAEAHPTFTHLVSNFAFAQPPSAQLDMGTLDSNVKMAAGRTKRRRVEGVEIPNKHNLSRDSSPVKGKAPKKKPRTITDLVIDQYVPKDSDPLPVPALSPSTVPQPFITKMPLNDAGFQHTNTSTEKSSRKRAKLKGVSDKSETKLKPKKATAKATKTQPIIEKLLSPSSALSRFDRQDFLFGTSSQLALDESPVTVRQLQMTIKASEQSADAQLGPLLADSLRWPKLGEMIGKKSHWAASTRHVRGGIFDDVEDVYIPEPDRTTHVRSATDSPNDEFKGRKVGVGMNEIDSPSLILISSDHPTPQHISSSAPRAHPIENDSEPMKDIVFKDIDDLEQGPPPSNQMVQDSFLDINDVILPPSAQTKNPKPRKPPLGTAMHGSRLEKRPMKQPKSHSTKVADSAPTISADEPFALSGNKDSQALSSGPSTPRKSIHRFNDIEEILDSEDERLEALSPTPPRIQNKGASPSLQLVSLDAPSARTSSKSTSDTKNDHALTPIHRIPVQNLEWKHIKKQVFDKITAHVRSLTPTTDPKAPSWHERILMYDPIVLEDFTVYLNSNTDARTYKKATQKQIKDWNRMLKRDGQNALKADENEGEILAVERDLEPYMAQGWCESLSICCIWGEGRGKGGVRKGLYQVASL